MLTRDFLRARTDELRYFFSWRFGFPHWVKIVAKETGVPETTCRRLKRSKIGTMKMKHCNYYKLESFATRLGWKPGLPFAFISDDSFVSSLIVKHGYNLPDPEPLPKAPAPVLVNHEEALAVVSDFLPLVPAPSPSWT